MFCAGSSIREPFPWQHPIPRPPAEVGCAHTGRSTTHTSTHLGVTALELAGQQVAEPALQQGHDAAQEEEPHAPHGRPEAHAGALAHRAGVEPVVNEVLQVLIFRMGEVNSVGPQVSKRQGKCNFCEATASKAGKNSSFSSNVSANQGRCASSVAIG